MTKSDFTDESQAGKKPASAKPAVHPMALLRRLKEAAIELDPKVFMTYRQKWELIVPLIHKAADMAEAWQAQHEARTPNS